MAKRKKQKNNQNNISDEFLFDNVGSNFFSEVDQPLFLFEPDETIESPELNFAFDADFLNIESSELSFDGLDTSFIEPAEILPIPAKPTTTNIAQIMLDHIKNGKNLYQIYLVQYLNKFDDHFLYINKNGNPAVSLELLKEFRRISFEFVVWNRKERFWRLRRDTDPNTREVEN